MKILYLSASYFPSRRASSIQVMRMSAALSRAGHEVLVVGKRSRSRQEPGVDDLFAFYGVPRSFELRSLRRPAVKGGGLLFRLTTGRLLRSLAGRFDLLYCRDAAAAGAAARRGLPFLFEAHEPPAGSRALGSWRRFLAAPSCRRLVSISSALLERLRELDLVPEGLSTTVAHDAADPMEGSETDAAPLAGRPGSRIGYLGQLYPGKGAELVVRLAAALPDLSFHLLGGTPERLARLAAAGPPANLTLHGFVPPAATPSFYGRLDVLLLPYQRTVRGPTGRSDLAPWMSPLKMFEAMAAGRAIVASSLPVLEEVLRDRHNALLVSPDRLPAWEEAVRVLVEDPDLRASLGERARADLLARFTWDLRAEAVLRGL